MNYWVAVATFGGVDDQYETFVRARILVLLDPRRNTEIPADVRQPVLQSQQGDRIALKRMLGRGAIEIEARRHRDRDGRDRDEWSACIELVSSRSHPESPVSRVRRVDPRPVSARRILGRGKCFNSAPER